MREPPNHTALCLQCAFCALLLQWALFISKATCLSVDGVALITFRNKLTSDPYNALGDWNASDYTPCAWSGVTCASSMNQDNASSVVSLELMGKMLSGSISPALGGLTSLQTLKLQGNSLNGSLPVELFNANSLQTFLLGGNHITGPLPSEVGNLVNLKFFDISSNSMLGPIPESLTRCTQLQSLILARNLFSGPLPDGFGTNFTSLKQLDLSSNLFSGSIPTDYGKLSALQGTLNLSYNHLSGAIPLSLGDLPYTVSLDLSHNNLSGRIPQDGSLTEQGPGPFLYNPSLCGFPLNVACPVTPFLSPLPSLPTEGSAPPALTSEDTAQLNSSRTPQKASLSPGSIAAIVIGDAAAVSLIAALSVYLYSKARGRKEKNLLTSCVGKDVRIRRSRMQCFRLASTSEESEGSPGSEKDREQGELIALDKEFSLDIDELLRASAFVLGKSGLGIVYKVVLANGTPVVVRRIGEGGSQNRKDFEMEVHAVGKLRHPNLVRLLAYYWANDEKLLVYEFISHGSLASALHGHHPQKPSRVLTWEERLRIARGVARGLAYLHECSPRKYVHGDIKTTKILLDGGMHPYIADFGLAKLAMFASFYDTTGGQSTSSTTMWPTYSAAVEWSGPQTGTSAACMRNMYSAPEVDMVANAKPTQKWDVYGYGVVVMELICGRVQAMQLAAAGVDFMGWMRKGAVKEGGLAAIVDPAIRASAQLPSMAALLSLAMACTSPSPDHRPKMRAISDSLDKLILHTVLRTNPQRKNQLLIEILLLAYDTG